MKKLLDLLNIASEVLNDSELNAYLYAHYSTVDNYFIAKQIGASIDEICDILDSANQKVDNALMNIAIQEQIKANIIFTNSANNTFCATNNHRRRF